MKLSKKVQELAKTFLMEQARPLERSLYRFHFEKAPASDVLSELAPFQNSDGGFGNAIEPDLRTPRSTAMSTSGGFQVLREIHAPATTPAVRGGIDYLLHTYDENRKAWEPTGPFVNDAPHAPWWHYNAEATAHFGAGLANPRAELVGYLFDYQSLVPESLLAVLLDDAIAHLDTLPEQMDMHDLLCYMRLVETQSLPETARTRMLTRLRRSADLVVLKDATQWAGYGLKPLWLAPTPMSPFAEQFAEIIETNLDYDIGLFQEDGSVALNFVWEGEGAQEALHEWKGCATLNTLRTLRAYGRLE